MTIQEAINQCDTMKPNQYSHNDKIRWLSIIDGKIKNEIIDEHIGFELITFEGYDDVTETDTVLLVPEPYSDLYVLYLFAQIDFNNAEFTRYNNSVMMFNSSYVAYQNYYNRKNMPLSLNSFKA